MVYLVGSGPGDPGLITVKALDLLKKADVVLYDRLADSTLLSETKPGCILIDVGKSAGQHTKTQDETTDLLAEYGKKGLRVVRLKGGDPYMFGRGGEEAERLKEDGIPFEIVPGISALNGVTAYAGVPVTHRNFASSVGVATGHGAKNKDEDPVRWRELAKAVDTIVVFMGIGLIGNIVEELIAGGIDPETPAAVIERGATPAQRVVKATVATIAETVKTENVKPPALLVIGKTAGIGDTLEWYNPGPLGGKTIAVTRPLAQSKAFSERLRSLGARPVIMPVIEAKRMIDSKEVETAVGNAGDYDCIVFASVNGVDAFFAALKKYGGDARRLAGVTLAAIGPVTGDALERYGVKADIVAERYVAEGLAEALTVDGSAKGKRYLLARSNLGRDILRKGLEAAGAIVDEAVFYNTVTAELPPYATEILEKGDVHIITFTSSSTVDSFFDQVPANLIGDSVKFASIGPQTTKTMQKRGYEPDVEAEVYTTQGLADAILKTFGN